MKNKLPWLVSLLGTATLSVATLAGCGTSDNSADETVSTPSLSIQGLTEAPTALALMARLDARGTEFCKGGTSGPTCCTVGTGCNPAMWNMTIYKVWLSTNEDCSNPALAADNGDSPTAKDLTQSPTLITGNPDPGTYKCVILQISDTMPFKVNSTAASTLGGNCGSESATYNLDIYRADDTSAWYNEETGSTMTGAGTSTSPTAQSVSIYASTNVSAITKGSVN